MPRKAADVDKRNQLLDLFVSGRDTLAIIGTIVGIVVWSLSYFQSKTDAAAAEERTNHRVEKVETKMDDLTKGVADVAKDTSYIRGRLEPKSK